MGELAPAPLSRYPVGHEQRRTPRTMRRHARVAPEVPAVALQVHFRYPGGEEAQVVHSQDLDPRCGTLAVSRTLHRHKSSKIRYGSPKGKVRALELDDRILPYPKEWRRRQLADVTI